MKSPNKVPQDGLEAAYVAIVATFDCVVCAGRDRLEVHEFKQGRWYSSVHACYECHRGKGGWHGDRTRWAAFKVDMLTAINRTVGKVMAVLMEAKVARKRPPTMRAPTPKANSATQRSSKTVPRRI